MRRRVDILVGVEIGTSAVRVAVGEAPADGPLAVTGLGTSISGGVRKGEIVDLEAARKSLDRAVRDAEHRAGVEIRTVYLAATGGHTAGFDSRGSSPVGTERVVTPAAMLQAVANAKAVNIPVEHEIIHTIRQGFRVDGGELTLSPQGLSASRLEAQVHIVHGLRSRLETRVNCVTELSLEVDDLVLGSLASALAVLTPEQKERGVIVIDIGAGVTDYIVYANGAVRHTGAFAVGGEHIANDVAIGLRIPLAKAERLKRDEGTVARGDLIKMTDPTIRVDGGVGYPDRTVRRKDLHTVLWSRAREILELVHKDVESRHLLSAVGAGVVLTGGSARLRGLRELAEDVFRMSAQVGTAHGFDGIEEVLRAPECATVLGLLRYARNQRRELRARGRAPGRRRIGAMVDAVRNFLMA